MMMGDRELEFQKILVKVNPAKRRPVTELMYDKDGELRVVYTGNSWIQAASF